MELSTYKAFASCRNVQQLNLSNSVYLSDDHVQTITERMPALLGQFMKLDNKLKIASHFFKPPSNILQYGVSLFLSYAL